MQQNTNTGWRPLPNELKQRLDQQTKTHNMNIQQIAELANIPPTTMSLVNHAWKSNARCSAAVIDQLEQTADQLEAGVPPEKIKTVSIHEAIDVIQRVHPDATITLGSGQQYQQGSAGGSH